MTSIWLPPVGLNDRKPPCPADYIDPCGHGFIPSTRRGYLSVPVLPNLTGHPWDEITLAYVQGLRPSMVRVVRGEETTDAWLWRVTVYLDDRQLIRSIEQEVEVGLPPGVEHGAALASKLKRAER
jgi:hypothetical protein